MLTQAKRQTVRLVEHVHCPPSRVDRANGFVRGVKILGATSKNGREYSPNALREAAALYEGLGVNTNHPGRETPNANRRVEDAIGWLENVRVRDGAVYGDLAILKSHPLANSIFEFAERNPGRFGLSHNAAGRLVQRNGKAVVESIESVRSVDLVQNPATVNSLFESEAPVADRKLSDTVAKILAMRGYSFTAKCQVIGEVLQEMDGRPMNGGAVLDDTELRKAIRAELDKPTGDREKLQAIRDLVGPGEVEHADARVAADEVSESRRESLPHGYRAARSPEEFLIAIGAKAPPPGPLTKTREEIYEWAYGRPHPDSEKATRIKEGAAILARRYR